MPSPISKISDLATGKQQRIKATVISHHSHRIKNGSLMTEAVVADQTGSARVVWFTKAPVDLETGMQYIFTGPYEDKYGRVAFQKPSYVSTGKRPTDKTLSEDPPPPVSPSVRPRNPGYASRSSYGSSSDYSGWIFGGLVVLGIILFIVWDSSGGNDATCTDVTSYDYNWGNDVKCTKSDGSTFYTDYSGGRKHDPSY